MREIPKELYTIDDGFKKIARGSYTKRQLERLHAENATGGKYLVIRSSDRCRGINLIFEKKENRRWEITDENRRRIFNDGSVNAGDYLDQLIEGVEEGTITDSEEISDKLRTLKDFI
jgi:hypothetical protein